jgi:hypothetical protein
MQARQLVWTALLCGLWATAAYGEADTSFLGNGHNGDTTLSGATATVNVYGALSSSAAAGDTALTLGTGLLGGTFAANDLVMVYQSTGLESVPASGTQTAIDLDGLNSGVGSFEFAHLSAVTTTGSAVTLTLTAPLVRGFPVAVTQVIKVPEYGNLTIPSGTTLKPLAWDGQKGGVVAFLATGTVTNNGSVDASGLGFRGGVAVNEGATTFGCTELDGTSPLEGAKGEGVAAGSFGATFAGRGNLANAGGGGDCHNAGGAGGGHGTFGGPGGRTYSGDGSGRVVGGLGGVSLSYLLVNRFLLGGGGGAGHENNSVGSSGGIGGGVVFIRANALSGAGTLKANGSTAASGQNDGQGGGGAGGSVSARFVGAAACGGIQANGGNGGTVGASQHGPGGGGGTGKILLQSASGTCTTTATAGVNGTESGGTAYGSSPGTTPSGTDNVIQTITGGTTVPVPTVTFPTAGSSIANNKPTITGNANLSAATTVLLFIDGAQVGTVNSSGTGAYSFPLTTALSQGSHTVQAADVINGIQGAKSTAITFTVDTTAPGAPTVTAPAASANLNTKTPTFTGTGETNDIVTVQVNGITVCTATVVAGAWSCVSSTETEGNKAVTATQTDLAGNVSPTTSLGIFIDSVAPDTAYTQKPPAQSPSSTADFTVFASDAAPSSGVIDFQCKLDSGSFVSCPQIGSGLVEYTNLSNGSHTLLVRAKDAAGNVDPTPDTYTWTVDTSAPATPAVTTPANGALIAASPQIISGTADASVTVTVTMDGQALCTTTASGTGAWACAEPATLADGAHTASAVATDLAGNSSSPGTSTFTINSQPGSLVITAPSNGAVIKVAAFTGTSTAGDTITVTVGGSTCTTTSSGSGSWSCTVAPALTDGTYSATVTARTTAGVTTTATVAFTIDTTAPVASIPTAPPALTNSPSATFGLACNESGCTFQCAVDSSTLTSCPKSFTRSGLADGSHTLNVTATDAAGNVSAQVSYTWTIDSTDPGAPTLTQPASGATVANPSPAFAGRGEVGDTVSVLEGTAVLCTAVVDSGGNWTCTTSAVLSQGGHTVSVSQRDMAGNTGAATTSSFTIDTTPPDTAITAGPSAALNPPTATFTFTSTEASSTFSCSLNGGAFSPCGSPLNLSGLRDGANTLAVRATDPAGNTDPTPATYSWQVDATAPATPSFATPNAGQVLATGAVSLSGTAEPGSTVTLTVDGTAVATVTASATGDWSYTLVGAQTLSDGAHTATATATDAVGNASAAAQVGFAVDTAPPDTTLTQTPANPSLSTSGTFAFTSNEAGVSYLCGLDLGLADGGGGSGSPCTSPATFTGLSPGSHTFQVAAVDAAGNVDPTPATYTWTVDTSTGAVSITSPADGSVTPSSQPTITGTTPIGTTVTVTYADGPQVACQDLSPDAQGVWTCPWALGSSLSFADGPHTVTAQSKDGSGNQSSPVSTTFTVDTAPPDTSITSGPQPLSNRATASFQFASTESGATYQCTLDGAPVACTSTLALTGLADGQHTVTVAAVDAAGNVDPTPASQTWTIDTVPPQPPVVASPGNGASVASSTPSLNGTATPGETVIVTIDGTLVCTAVADAATGLWTCPTLPTQADGQHALSAVATDAYGNQSAATNSTFIVDTHAPDTTLSSKPAAVSTTATATFDLASDEANVTYRCSLDGAAPTDCTNPITYTGLADGTHTFSAAAVDAAGNVDRTPATYSWNVDTTGVTVTLDSPAAGSTIGTGNPTLSGTATPGSTLTVSVNGAVVCASVVVDATGQWTCVLHPDSTGTPALTDGPQTATVTAVDPLGGTTTLTSGFVVDTVAPDTTLVTTPPLSTPDTTGTFQATSDESGVSYECSLDGAAFASCANPEVLTGLSAGSHTFQVRAKDAAGNVDATPASYTWTVTGGTTTSSSSSGSSSSGSSSGSTSSGSTSASTSGSTSTSTSGSGTGSTSASTGSSGSTSGSGSTGSSATSSGSSGSSGTHGSGSTGSGSGSTGTHGSGSTGSSGHVTSTGSTSGSGSTGSGSTGSGSTGSSDSSSGAGSTGSVGVAGGGCGCGAGSDGSALEIGAALMLLGLRRRRSAA